MLLTPKVSAHDIRVYVRIVAFRHSISPLEPKVSMSVFCATMSSSATSTTFSPFQCILWISSLFKSAPPRLRVSNVRLPNTRERNGLWLFDSEVKFLRWGSSGSCAASMFNDAFAAHARSVIRWRVGLDFRSLNRKGRYNVPNVRRRSIWTREG